MMLLRRIRNRHLLLIDLCLLAAAIPVAYVLRFEGLSWRGSEREAIAYLALAVPMQLLACFAAGLYRRAWGLASVAELEAVVLAGGGAALAGGVAGVIVGRLGLAPIRVPMSVLALDALFAFGIVAAPRLAIRAFSTKRARSWRREDPHALIAGAGVAGQLIAKELLTHPQLGIRPVGFVDDDPRKQRLLIAGLPVLGPVERLPAIARKHGARELVIAMPSAPGGVIRSVVQAARGSGMHVRTVPGLYEILSGRVGISTLRAVQIDDLLRRDPVRTDLDRVRELLQGRTVLITGAGGSIGGELCRQVSGMAPARLVALGHGENSIFEITGELRRRFPGVEIASVIADIRDEARIREICARERPHVIFHAAAHKHVPLMEENVVEAVTNNVLGTRNVVRAAVAADVPHLVMISTDKAVRPTSVMGASKRAAELVVQQAAERGRHYVAVRFGNVLGSRGSVVPIFLRQIREGGPVTLTHPDMCRYFMTIPEAVQLVLQAAVLGSQGGEGEGELFVLDMGEPVRIVDMAKDLIRLCGLEPGTDIEIRFTGIRPGEKLYEEVFFDEEHATPTEHPKVLRGRQAPAPGDVAERIEVLIEAAGMGEGDDLLRQLLQRVVPEFATRAALTTAGSAPGSA